MKCIHVLIFGLECFFEEGLMSLQLAPIPRSFRGLPSSIRLSCFIFSQLGNLVGSYVRFSIYLRFQSVVVTLLFDASATGIKLML